MYVGFVGPFLTGKSTIGKQFKELVEGQGLGEVYQVDISKPLKDEVAAAHGVTYEDVERDKSTYRTELQELGMFHRETDVDYLVKIAEDEAAKHPHAYIENVRMMNEADFLMANGWFLVGIDCDQDLRMNRYKAKYGRLPTQQEIYHPTETEIAQVLTSFMIPVFTNNTEEDAEKIALFLYGMAKNERDLS